MVGLLIAVAVGACVLLVGRSLVRQPSRSQHLAIQRLKADTEHAPQVGNDSSFGNAVRTVGGWVGKPNSRQAADLQTQLSLAGYRDPAAVGYYLGLQLLLACGLMLLLGSAAALIGSRWLNVLLWATMGGAVGFLLPSMLLRGRIQKRQALLRKAFPDATDVMVLSIEGGVSLNAALARVAEEIQAVHPVLGEELSAVQQEVQLGLSPGEAFRNLADRCGLEEARDLSAALLQTEAYGASAAKALRAYAENARKDRQAWAEEMAQKAAVKIVFPMLLCIFPAIFMVLLGPAAAQMARIFAK